MSDVFIDLSHCKSSVGSMGMVCVPMRAVLGW
jgi:hypothetical protein